MYARRNTLSTPIKESKCNTFIIIYSLLLGNKFLEQFFELILVYEITAIQSLMLSGSAESAKKLVLELNKMIPSSSITFIQLEFLS